jgi:hypothetical protein
MGKNKWIDSDKFKQFVDQKKKEQNEKASDSVGGGFFLK